MAISYKVQSGDTLGTIAKRYGTTVSALATANGISNPDRILAGQSLLINGNPSATPPTPAAPAPVNTMPATALGANNNTYVSYFPTPTAATGLATSALSSKDAFMASKAAEADKLTQVQTEGKTAIQKLFDAIGGSATKKANLYETAGINDNQKELDQLNNEIDATSKSFDDQIAVLQQNNPEGALVSGMNADVNRLKTQKAVALANYAIVLNAKTRNFTTAKSIIDQKADAETEDLKNQLAGLRFFYDENAQTLSDDQKTLLSEKIRQADDELQKAKDVRTQIGDLQLTVAKNGAPISIVTKIGSAASLEDALKAAGSYAKNKTADGGFDLYTAEDKRAVVQAGLSGASSQVKNIFLNTPAEFRQTYTRNNGGNDNSAVTPEIILRNLSEWEAYKKSQSQGDSSVDALVQQLRGS